MAVSFSISEIRMLSEQMSQQLGLPFNYMTHSFLKRRLGQFFEKYALRKTEQFLENLDDASFVDQLCHFFAVNNTELFRDAGFWRQLRKLIADNYTGKRFKVWFPDVSSGEELYSLLILLKEINCYSQVQVTVNNTSDRGIEALKKGFLSAKRNDVNAYNYKRFEGTASLDDYFNNTSEGAFFDADLLSNVSFTKGGIEQLSGSKYDFVILRNSLLYYTKEYHETVQAMIDKVLMGGGYVCLGVKEQLPANGNERFECIDQKEKIYCKYSFLKD
ncbi:CheR family methyltransferase [Carboxylicivirga taeanensis]|uniref:CheR family methyltransferase n=1 Tax=Carboxylicivirga taeanensis TaxID=1416875 RepID=UPI003F6DC9E7